MIGAFVVVASRAYKVVENITSKIAN